MENTKVSYNPRVQKWSRWTQDERNRLTIAFGVRSTKGLVAEFPGRTRVAIMQQAKIMGLHADRYALLAQSKRRYTHDTTYFRDVRPEASYWAGFIAADGNVSANTLSFNLQHGDGAHLERFKSMIRHTGPLVPKKAAPGHQAQVGFRLHGARPLINDLEQNYNITPRKSLTLQPPAELDELNSLAFIAGVIDGDGNIRIMLAASETYPQPAICVVGTLAVLSWIADWFDQIAPPRGRASIPHRKTPSKALCTYTIASSRAVVVAECILSLNLPLLDRKWSIFDATVRYNFRPVLVNEHLAHRGEASGMSKLTENQVRSILTSPSSGVELARMYSVHPSLIYAIRNRRIWRHVVV